MGITNMVIIRWSIIYILVVVCGFGLNGESVGTPAPDTILTKELFSKSVINNSSLTSASNNRTKFIVEHFKETPHIPISTTTVPVQTTPHNEALSTTRNNVTKTTVTEASTMTATTTVMKKKTTQSNYNNELNTLTRKNNEMSANGKSDNSDVITKIPPISESDSKNNTNTSNLALDDGVTVTFTKSPDSENDKVERIKQIKTLAPINEHKILLTGNSHNEQLNNGISWMPTTDNYDAGNGGGRGYVPRSGSNSIIAAVDAATTSSTTTTVPPSNREVSIAKTVKMPEIPNETIEPFTSDEAHEKSTPIYIARTPSDGDGAYSESPSSLLSTPLSMADDKSNGKVLFAQSKIISFDEPLFTTNKTVGNSIKPSLNTEKQNTNTTKIKKVPIQYENFAKTLKLTADGTVNAVDSSKLYNKTPTERTNKMESIWHKNIGFPIKNNLIEVNTNTNEIPINLNQNGMHPVSVEAAAASTVQQVASSAVGMWLLDDENKKENDDTTAIEQQQQQHQKKLKTAASRLIKTDENQTENGSPNKSTSDEKTNHILFDTNRRTFVFGLTTQTTTAATTTMTMTTTTTTAMNIDMAPAAYNASTYTNILHANSTIQTNNENITTAVDPTVAVAVAAHEKPTQNKIELNTHNDSLGNQAKTSIDEIWFINSNGTTTRHPFETSNKFTANTTPKGGTSNNTRIATTSSNILSKPSEIINLSTSKLTMSSLLVDEENNDKRNSVNTLVTHSNAIESLLNNVQRSFIRSQDTETNKSSTIIPFEYNSQNIDNDNDREFSSSSSSSTTAVPSKLEPAIDIRSNDDFKSVVNGTDDEAMPATRSFALHGEILSASSMSSSLQANYVNNFLTAAITAEHEVGNQFAIDYSNGTNNANDRCDSLFYNMQIIIPNQLFG